MDRRSYGRSGDKGKEYIVVYSYLLSVLFFLVLTISCEVGMRIPKNKFRGTGYLPQVSWELNSDFHVSEAYILSTTLPSASLIIYFSPEGQKNIFRIKAETIPKQHFLFKKCIIKLLCQIFKMMVAWENQRSMGNDVIKLTFVDWIRLDQSVSGFEMLFYNF